MSPDARFRGVSKAILNQLEARALELGNNTCALTSTETARRFYLSAGYVQFGPPEPSIGKGSSYRMVKRLFLLPPPQAPQATTNDCRRANDSRAGSDAKRFTEAAYELDAFKPNLSRTDAEIRIAMLTAKLKCLTSRRTHSETGTRPHVRASPLYPQ